MIDNIEIQKKEYENIYHTDNLREFDFNFTEDKLIRFLRDRRLEKSLKFLKSKFLINDLRNWKVLIICGGVGGEGHFFKKSGFSHITTSDFSNNSLAIANKLTPSINTLLLNAENIELEAGSFDLVVVQDGLHHLTRPQLGFTEMLRVASKAVIVIEPYESLVGKVLGTQWEVHGNSVNFVYRWNRGMINQTVKSYLLDKYTDIKVYRLWDHNSLINKIVRYAPEIMQIILAKVIYFFLSLINFSGNMMVAIICKV